MFSKIATGVALAAFGSVVLIPGLFVYSHKKSYDGLTSLTDQLNESEKLKVQRYTCKELKQVVGRTPSTKWTKAQVEQLDQMYNIRRAKRDEKEAIDSNKGWELPVSSDCNKGGGLLQLCAPGPPDSVDHRYQYYKNYEVVDDDYKEYIQNEIRDQANRSLQMWAKMIKE